MKTVFGLMVLSLLAANVQADEYFRSIDNSGNVHYGDSPLPGSADFERLKAQSKPSADDSLPFETRRAKEKFPITLYVADSCGDACAQAQAYLNKRGIPFTEKNLAAEEDIAAFKKASGGDQIPVMNIGNKWLKGFLASQWGSELDNACYPKDAPYRPAVKPLPATEKPKSE
jgi:glutaredoxin